MSLIVRLVRDWLLQNHDSESGAESEAAAAAAKMYACCIPGCVDRRGRPKQFQRKEHKKRHERTVHHAGPHVSDFTCWVVRGKRRCGRVFSRRDNLAAHLSKSHGPKSQGQRTPYVAHWTRARSTMTRVGEDRSLRTGFPSGIRDFLRFGEDGSCRDGVMMILRKSRGGIDRGNTCSRSSSFELSRVSRLSMRGSERNRAWILWYRRQT